MTETMRRIVIDKLTLNFGAGKEQKLLEKGVQLIEMIAGKAPVKTITQKRIPNWGLRPGLPVGARLTLRGKEAEEVLKRLLTAKDNKLAESCVDNYGNISFGVPEYIDIPGVKYDPQIGIIGLQASLTLRRPGYRVARRKLRKSAIGKQHRIGHEEAVKYIQENFKTEITS